MNFKNSETLRDKKSVRPKKTSTTDDNLMKQPIPKFF